MPASANIAMVAQEAATRHGLGCDSDKKHSASARLWRGRLWMQRRDVDFRGIGFGVSLRFTCAFETGGTGVTGFGCSEDRGIGFSLNFTCAFESASLNFTCASETGGSLGFAWLAGCLVGSLASKWDGGWLAGCLGPSDRFRARCIRER